jgi:hypothetical protein
VFVGSAPRAKGSARRFAGFNGFEQFFRRYPFLMFEYLLPRFRVDFGRNDKTAFGVRHLGFQRGASRENQGIDYGENKRGSSFRYHGRAFRFAPRQFHHPKYRMMQYMSRARFTPMYSHVRKNRMSASFRV